MKNKTYIHLIHVMKISVGQLLLITLLCNLALANESSGQKVESVFDVDFDLSVNNETALKVFSLIEQRTDFKFAFDKRLLKDKAKVSLNEKTLGGALIEMSSQLQLNFRQVNNAIAVSKALEKENKKPVEVILVDQEITGEVLDSETGEPLIGATVRLKGTSIGAVTDIDGTFSLSVSELNGTLIFSYIGYKPIEVPIGNQTSISIFLEPDLSALKEVVIVGYGTQDIANLTSPVSKLPSELFKDMPITSIDQGLASQLPGVEVVQSSGRPGQSNQINIRGIATITAGTGPLIVVDGLPLSEETSLNVINPNDIASVEVLKDAASASIYGSRGSNGVILITTKKGVSGKTRFSFDAYEGVQQVAHKVDLMNAQEHAIWDRDARNNYYLQFDDGSFSVNDDNATREAKAGALGFNSRKAIIPSYVQPYLDGESGLTDTDWQDELFRKSRIRSYQISAQGGSDNVDYFVSGNYFKQEGIVLGTDFERVSFRSNIQSDLSDKLKFSMNLSPSLTSENVVAEGFNDGPINAAIISLPYFPAYNNDGSLAISKQVTAATEGDQSRSENPVAMALLNKDERKNLQLIGGSFLEYEVIPGLKAKTFFGMDYSNFRRETFNPSIVGTRNNPAPLNPTASTSSAQRVNWIVENTLNYEASFEGGHNFDALVGYTYQEDKYQYSEVTATDFPNDFVETLNAGIINGGLSLNSEWALVSYLGRVRYNFNGKYLFTAAIRRDGSSRFGASNRWGVFPSFSAGYRISDEAFFPQTDVINDLKLRFSWGQTGNNQIGDFGSQALLTSSNAIIGGGIESGLAPQTSPNANLGWEETSTLDFGIDFGFFEDRIIASLDYYIATTNDLLLEVPVAAHSGFTSSLQNIGSVENKGLEFILKARYDLGPIKATTNFNLASNKNKVLELGPGQDEIITGRNITRVGEELGASYGYKVLGVFTSEDQINSTPSLSSAQVGEYIYADTNGDLEINADDRVVLGSIHPDYTFGLAASFEYKGFDIAAVVQGVKGVHIHNRTVSVLLYNPEGWNNGSKDYFDNYYTEERGASAIYARPNALPSDNGFYRETDLLQEDASFIRVRNITLGYTIPVAITEKVGIENVRLYLSSKNPFTFTDYRGFNPEQRTDNVLDPTEGWGNYPVEKSFVLGLNMNF